jgi:hypothetical protein
MKERAVSIGAKLRIWSGPGVGTDVEISVPHPLGVRSRIPDFFTPIVGSRDNQPHLRELARLQSIRPISRISGEVKHYFKWT